MAYRKIYLEWSIENENLHYNVPVGFEVQLSKDKYFKEVTYTFNTFNEINYKQAYRFEYSLDNGDTWIQFPWGDQGKSFITNFKMRLSITPSDLGYSLSFSEGVLKKISVDSKEIIDTAELDFEEIIDTDQYGDVLYLVGSKTLYKIDGITLNPYNNSLPLLSDNTLGVVVDESRKSFWQINRKNVWLRNLYGDLLCEINIPEIDIDYSSSSS